MNKKDLIKKQQTMNTQQLVKASLLTLALLLTSAAKADTNISAPSVYTVTTTADSGTGSLRAAIASANSTATNDTINFNIPTTDAGCASGVCTITLTSGELVINDATTAGTLTITNTTGANNLILSGNNTNRIFNVNTSGNLTLSGVTMTNGKVTGGDGGAVTSDGTLTVTNSVITGNTAIYDSSSGNGGNGGGINMRRTLTVTNSTISGNTASGGTGGGGIWTAGSVTVTNSTISGNTTSSGTGGGINVSGTLTVTNSTVSGNVAGSGSTRGSGGGIYRLSFNDTVSMLNTIVARNTDSGSYPDFRGATLSNSNNNIIGDGTGATINGTNNQIGTSANPINPRLTPLGNYGGTTQTIALLAGSPAINAGTATGAPTTDQRGAARVGATDIGAFEFNSTTNGGTYRAALLGGRQTVGYNTTLTSYDDVKFPNFTYAVTSGALPDGLTLTKTSSFIAATQTVALTGTPTKTGAYNFTVTTSDGTNTNATDYSINVTSPTAAAVTVSGRVVTAKGARGIRSAVVTMTDQDGTVRYATTSTFGYFRFADVPAGQTYIFNIRAKRFTFGENTIVRYLNGDTDDLVFTAY